MERKNMSKNKYGNTMALKEHMLGGNIISRLESIVLFGISNLTACMSFMKKEGFIIKSQKVPMIKIVSRLNKYTVCKPPKDLPTKEIIMIEYWISR